MTLELVIVGGGPAGLAAAHAAQRCGIPYLVLEQARIAQTIEDYPRRKPLHSPPQDLELAWGELYSQQQPNATREELLVHYARFIRERGLAVRDGECVRSIERSAEGFMVRTGETAHAARKVLVATGGFGVPRRLGVPGETRGASPIASSTARPTRAAKCWSSAAVIPRPRLRSGCTRREPGSRYRCAGRRSRRVTGSVTRLPR